MYNGINYPDNQNYVNENVNFSINQYVNIPCNEDIQIKDLAKTFLVTSAITAFDYKMTPLISKAAVTNWGLCLGNFASKAGINFLGSIISPIAQFNDKLGSLFGSNRTAQIFIPAACEEIEFRWLIQEVLLRKLPKEVCERFAPNFTHLVDSTPARISRIAAVSLLFAFSHVNVLDCSEGGGISQLIGGAIYGVVSECTDLGIFGAINSHCIFNALNEIF